MRKNILVIAKYATSAEEGFETRTHILCREMSQWANIHLVFSNANHKGSFKRQISGVKRYEDIEGFTRYLINTFQYSKSASINRIISWIDFEVKVIKNWRLFSDVNIDTVVISSLSLFSVFSGLYMKVKFGAKLVMEVRDIWPLVMTEEAGFKRWHPLVLILGLIEKLGYRKSDTIIGTMPNLGSHVSAILGYNRKVECVPFGIYEEDLVKRPFSSSKYTNILYAGSIGITNGLGPYIETILKRSKEFQSERILFHFAGDGDKLEEYKRKLAHLDNVSFYGNLNVDELKNLILKMDVAYFSSVNSKAYDYGWSPNKLILYMRFGLPVIAGYTGYRSILNEAESGIFINPENEKDINNAIIHFARMSKEELYQLGMKGSVWLRDNRLWSELSKYYYSLLIKL